MLGQAPNTKESVSSKTLFFYAKLIRNQSSELILSQDGPAQVHPEPVPVFLGHVGPGPNTKWSVLTS